MDTCVTEWRATQRHTSQADYVPEDIPFPEDRPERPAVHHSRLVKVKLRDV